MKWTISPAARRPRSRWSSEEFKTTYIAGCVGGLIKSWQFPKHKTAGRAGRFPFKF